MSALLLPVILGWLAVRLLSPKFLNGDSAIAFVVQAVIVAVIVAASAERATRRFLPLAFLLNQSLVFPDEAPSRFGAALRANSLGRLDRRIDEIRNSHGDQSEQQAAVAALSLIAALSSHDRFTRGHTERVRAYADLIAIELGLSELARSRLSWGVLLHDIGKLTVPEEILNKTSKLTADEWTILRNHPLASAEFLEPLHGWLGEWGRAAAEHHERWDGNGYPTGLAGKDISLAGRITAVADAYDVITSARSYKAPMSAEAARRELVRCASEQFDPVVVRAMIQVSTGKQRNFGLWAWLAEIPTVARILAGVGSTTSGAAVAVAASIATIAAPLIDAAPTRDMPDAVAFLDMTPGQEDGDEHKDVPSGSEQTEQAQTPVTIPPASQASAAQTVASTPGSSTSAVPFTAGAAPVSPTIAADAGAEAPTTTQRTETPSSTAMTSSSTMSPSPTTTPPSTTSTAAPTSGSSSTTSTTSTTSPPASPIQFSAFLRNPGESDSNAHSILPLELEQPSSAAVGNFDSDRNGEPGITIKKQGNGFGGASDDEIQIWEYTTIDAGTIDGSVELELFIAAKDFDTGKKLGVAAALVLCDPTCGTVTTTTWTSESPESSWKKATLGFGWVSETVTAGDIVQLHIIVPDSLADDDMMFAYDSVSEPSALHLR